MPTILGYLRSYIRWNGTPGLTLEEQRAEVNRIARKLDGRRKRQREQSYHTEGTDGSAKKWPILKQLIERARKERGVILVIPTLDGVRLNLEFLDLVMPDNYVYDGTPICITDKHNFWMLTKDWREFKEMVRRVQSQNWTLSPAIKAGLEVAANRGVAIGGQRRGAHRFTVTQRRKGGRATAAKRSLNANKPYLKWIPDILRWRQDNQSITFITRQLASKGAKKPDGSKIGPMLVCRILKRIAAAN